MKVFCVLVVSCCLLPPTALLGQHSAPPDQWLAVDKLQHLVFSAHLTLLSYQVARQSYYNTATTSRIESAMLVLSLGVGKEVWDSKKPNDKFSYKDLVADALGIGLGLILGHNLK